tara:strand:- start:400 stop:1293 length:894 start_codon:yes stop_codon:yes gene_type:complete
MYFSKKNKNFMFETLSKVIFQETNTQIINNDKYINIYRLNYPTIFERIDTDELSILNKEVINIIGELIINDIQNSNINQPLINDTNIQMNNNININDKEIIPISQKILLYSSQRNINSKNRYDFNLNVNFNTFTPKYITLPKEENLIFSNPNINILFNNTDNLLFTLKETQKFGNLEYYIYETFTDTKIKCSNILDIKIKNYLMNSPIINYDIFYIHNIKKIKLKNKEYLCLDIKNHDIQIDDELGLFSNDKINIITTLFVKKIAQNYILTNLSEIDFNINYSCIQMNKNITLTIEK